MGLGDGSERGGRGGTRRQEDFFLSASKVTNFSTAFRLLWDGAREEKSFQCVKELTENTNPEFVTAFRLLWGGARRQKEFMFNKVSWLDRKTLDSTDSLRV